MIPEYKLYHGAVLAELVHRLTTPVEIDELAESGRLSAYILDQRVGLQIKHSSQRLHPWAFTFTRQNLKELLILRGRYEAVFLAFVCHTDGMVCLTLDEVVRLIDVGGADQGWLRIDRRRGQWYTVHGARALPIKRPRGLDALIENVELGRNSAAQMSSDVRNLLSTRES